MSDVGGIGPGASNVTLTFDDDAALALDPGVPLATGTYRPSNFEAFDPLPAPAPAPSAATMLQAFNGTNPNGQWRLYVVDDVSGDVGVIAGGWALDFVMAAQFCNSGPITINDAGAATPYPSPIVVSGVNGLITEMTATVIGFSHAAPENIDMVLATPSGSPMMLMSDTGGSLAVSNRTFQLDDNGPYTPSLGLAQGTYQPEDRFPDDTLPPPAPDPVGPYNVGFTYDGFSPNGTWNLYVADDQAGGSGSITRFCLNITTFTPVLYANHGNVTIPTGSPGTTSGPANPYPSTIEVSGVIGTFWKVTVSLFGVTHTYPRDLDVLVQSPAGQRVMLMSDVGGGNPGVSNATYTFDDDAFTQIPAGSNVAGTFAPSNDDSEGQETLPAPAPGHPYNHLLAFLNGYSPNGAWKLWIHDDAGGDIGQVAAGWSITVRTWLVPYGTCFNPNVTIPSGAPGTTQGPASMYPIVNPNFILPVDLNQYKVRVELLGLTHSYPRDLDVLVVGPLGHKVLLMSDAGGATPGLSNANLTFDEDAPATLPVATNPVSGVYKPTDSEPGDVFPGGAPAGPYATSLSVFEGTNPVGDWKLYLSDDALGDSGSLTGWCVRFTQSINAGVVSNLQWTDRQTIVWDPGPEATSYHLYRGHNGTLAQLADGTEDSCRRASGVFPTALALTEHPEGGSFYWYLVRGVNAQGEGPAGFARYGTRVEARVHNGAASCP
jgi:subtilisin-like proprotein convertase family protein